MRERKKTRMTLKLRRWGFNFPLPHLTLRYIEWDHLSPGPVTLSTEKSWTWCCLSTLHLCHSIILNCISAVSYAYWCIYFHIHSSLLWIKWNVSLNRWTCPSAHFLRAITLVLSVLMHFISCPFNSVSAPFSLSDLAGLFIARNEDWRRYSKINCFLPLLLKHTHTRKSKLSQANGNPDIRWPPTAF